MSARNAAVTETVSRCVPTQDGNWMVITRQGSHAVSGEELSEGTRIRIADGKAVRA